MQNQVFLTGRLGDKAEIRNTRSGGSVANLSIATEENYRDRNGNWQTKTTWHRVTVFSDKPDNKYAGMMGKGDLVRFEGKLAYGSYEKDGTKHYTTELQGYVQLLSQAEANRTQRSEDRNAPPASQPQKYDLDEEIPF